MSSALFDHTSTRKVISFMQRNISQTGLGRQHPEVWVLLPCESPFCPPLAAPSCTDHCIQGPSEVLIQLLRHQSPATLLFLCFQTPP